MAEEGTATVEGQQGDQQSSGDTEFGFPANTPVADMTPAQQSEYWREKAQKHERMLKSERESLGHLRPDQLKELRDKAARADALDAELASDTEKREKAAREAAMGEADAKYQPKLVETAFRIAIGDRKTTDEVNDFLEELNLGKFLTDGNVDTAKVLARVDQFAPATGTASQSRTGPSASGQGNRAPVGNDKGGPARAWLAKQGIKVD